MTDTELFLRRPLPGLRRRGLIRVERTPYYVEWVDPDDPRHIIAREADLRPAPDDDPEEEFDE